MSKTNTFENDLLRHIFQNADVGLVGDLTGLRGSAVAGSLYISLHTADPGDAGDQGTNEIVYTGYARVAVARDTSNWTVTGNTVENTNVIAFSTATGGSGTATHFGIGCAASGSGKLLYKGALVSSLAISAGVTPSFAAGALDGSED